MRPKTLASFIQRSASFGIVAAGQKVEEQAIGALVAADLVVDQPRIAIGQPHGIGMHLHALGIGEGEDLDQPHRVLPEEIVAGHVDAARRNLEPFHHALAVAKAGHQAGLLGPGELLVQLRQEHAGQAAHPLHLQEIEAHEALDRALAGSVDEIHARGHIALQVEGQPVLLAPGNGVQMAAHRPEEVLGPAKRAIFGAGQQAGIDQFGRGADLVDIFADPVERVQVAQAALALFNIGFDDIARIAHALVPLLALKQFFGDELLFRSCDDIGPEPLARLLEQGLVAPQEPPFQQSGADGQVLPGHLDHVVDAAAGMADLQPQIPQEIEHRLDHLLAPRRVLHRGDEGDVHVGLGRHLAAPVATHRNQRQPLARAAIGGGIDMGDDMVVDHADQLVDQEALRRGDLVPGGRLRLQPRGDFLAARRQRVLQYGDDLLALDLAVCRRNRRVHLGGQFPPVDDGALVGDAGLAHAIP